MKIVGLDPSMCNYGWAVVTRTRAKDRVLRVGCIQTKLSASKKLGKTEKTAIRLRTITAALVELLMREKPDRVYAELPAGVGRANTAVALAHSFAVTVAVCEMLDIELVFVSPTAMKRDVAGSLGAEKSDVAKAVEVRTGWCSLATSQDVREAEADAAGIALAPSLSDLLEER